jgi:hypothetical protein
VTSERFLFMQDCCRSVPRGESSDRSEAVQACAFRMVAGPLVNTAVPARWKDVLSTEELFQQVGTHNEKPLKRLTNWRAHPHRAKAAVLMRGGVATCEVPGPGAGASASGNLHR